MDSLQILQLLIGSSILYVWLVRSHRPSKFRVGNASTLREEVSEAGLPNYIYDFMRIVKPIFAFLLIIGVTWSPLTIPCMTFTTIFMIGALFMHFQAKDNLFKMIPALTLLFFCGIILFNN
tara:strand:- start:128 stop:490 length:363 start_codon:yes stop_codon:yes gene_type:complete